MGSVFFQSWEQIIRTIVATVSTYLALIVLLRMAGPRTLAKWYAFDLIVTVALGSTFATGVLAKDVTVAQAVVGFVVLIGLQFIIARTVVRCSRFRAVVNPPPTMVLRDGKLLPQAMRRMRVAEADIRAAVRQSGMASIEDVGAIVLEADGTFSVIGALGARPTALDDVPEAGGSEGSNRSV
jgi:uncharacterized membrane protein YcaP (DUF421 family)